MKNITKRDVKFFFIGLLTMLLLDIALDWDDHVSSFKRGFNDGYNTFTNK